MGAVFRENGLPGRSTSRYISTGVDIDRFLSKEVVEVQSLWPNIPGDKWNEMFSNTFLTICIFLFYAEQTLFLCPIFLFWNICLSAFFLPKILETCFFQQVFTFTGWNQDRTENLKLSSPLAYIDGPEGGTCMFCTRVPVGICQTTRKGDFLRTLQRGWWVSTHPGHSYITLPYLPDSPMIPTELSAITQTIYMWTVYHSGYWVLKMELETERWVFRVEAAAPSSLKPETPPSFLHPFCV